MSEAPRPDPDAILAELRPESRGRLRIFLGAAPGVGKTYAMLAEAKDLREHGVDVVGAVIETHGRAETEALLAGLDILPRTRLEYHGTVLQEMDLDTLLARRPQLALVDELAHHNAPGSRHERRYLDVEELLAAGISVWTTVNVQHLESLNDAVAQITGVRVRETVPDRLLERADEIEVIDLAPADLLRRLDEGKVYVPDTAQIAIHKFFRPGNLAALRELALRHAAQRVGDQVRNYMQAHAIEGPWPTHEHLVVCVSPSPSSARLVRTVRRMAERRNCGWTAAYVKGARHYHLADADRDRVAATLRLAEQLGGQAVTLPGEDVAAELLRYAKAHNATEIVVGQSRRSWWQELRHGSLLDKLVRRSDGIDVYIVSGPDDAPRERPAPSVDQPPAQARSYLAATLAVALAACGAYAIREAVALPNLSLVFLTAVLYSATTSRLGPTIYAAVLSVLAYDFLFVEPRLTFTVTHPEDVLMLFMYLGVAVLTSNLTARIRDQAEAAHQREAQTAALYSLSRSMAVAGELDDLLAGSVRHLNASLGYPAAVLLPEGDRLTQRAAFPPEERLTEDEAAAATWSWQRGQPAGFGSDTLPGLPWYTLPLRVRDHVLGVVAVRFPTGRPVSPARRRLLEALTDLAAVAIERASLARLAAQSQALAEADRLKSALLSTVSHDFRSPLASIKASVSGLLQDGAPVSPETLRELLTGIAVEADRLNRLVESLLDLSRLEAGAWQPQVEPTPVEELIGAALDGFSSTENARIDVAVAPTGGSVLVDPVQVVQVLHNLIENALKYAPAPGRIEVAVRPAGARMLFEVADRGPGLPPGDEERVFDPFYRAPHLRESALPGVGMGLAVCRGLVEANGGVVHALPRPGGGSLFRVELPGEGQPCESS